MLEILLIIKMMIIMNIILGGIDMITNDTIELCKK